MASSQEEAGSSMITAGLEDGTGERPKSLPGSEQTSKTRLKSPSAKGPEFN